MDHLQACVHCPKYDPTDDSCMVYAESRWVNRRGGCGMFPYRDLSHGHTYVDGKVYGPGRTGQQKQKHEDRKYHSKNDGKRKYKFVI